MSVWICDWCCYSRTGLQASRRDTREVDGMLMSNLETVCPQCWNTRLDLEPDWDWQAEGWSQP